MKHCGRGSAIWKKKIGNYGSFLMEEKFILKSVKKGNRQIMSTILIRADESNLF